MLHSKILSHKCPKKHKGRTFGQVLEILEAVRFLDDKGKKFCLECVDHEGHFFDKFAEQYARGRHYAVHFVIEVAKRADIVSPVDLRKFELPRDAPRSIGRLISAVHWGRLCLRRLTALFS